MSTGNSQDGGGVPEAECAVVVVVVSSGGGGSLCRKVWRSQPLLPLNGGKRGIS